MPAITPGTKLDRYQIISLLGAGGMGEVYLAHDTRLGRKVALKFLPTRFTQDSERLKRFAQEAQAASALNHPNIITIYEVGHADETHFIATEFIDGMTLRRRLTQGRLSIDDALDIAIQTASALVAAHAAGIVHRDIKPENIMLRPDGYVKVLDFGLAKLTEKSDQTGNLATTITTSDSGSNLVTVLETVAESITDPDREVVVPEKQEARATRDSYETTPLLSEPDTAPGMVMGTAQYMSPEHARGLKVDARTDIFSLGVVLYEMATAVHPFTGQTRREVIAAVLYSEQPPIARFRSDAPDLFEWTVTKALTKDRDERYQTAKELLNDLRRLQHRLRVDRENARTHGQGTVGLTSGRSTTELGTTGELKGRTTSKLSNYLRRLRNRPSAAIFVTAGLLLVAAIMFMLHFRLLGTSPQPFSSMRLAPFTTSGRATRAAISPDGKYVVYVESDQGKQSLWVRQVAVTNNIEIVGPAEVLYRGLTFSPDGNYIFYLVQEGNNPIQVLYQVPVLGGQPRKILTDIDSPIAFRSDGAKFAFVRRSRGAGNDKLIIADADGTNERQLAERTGPDFFGLGGPAWSLDNQSLAMAAGSNAGGRFMNVVQIDSSSGVEKQVSPHRWNTVGRVAYLRRGGLIVSAIERGATMAQIWQIPHVGAEPVRITNDLSDYRDMSLTDDSRGLVTVQSAAHVNIWLVPGGDSSRARRITSGIGQYNGVRGFDWLTSSRVVYVSRLSGSQDIWTMNLDGSDQRQLTTPETGADVYPVSSPDGQTIVFVSTRSGNSNLYRIDPNGGSLVQLTHGNGEEFPDISPDGKWVIYNDTGSSRFTLWRVPIQGGTPTQLTYGLSQWPDVSPDGKMIGCWYRSEPTKPWQLAVLPFDGGDPKLVLDVPVSANASIPLKWMPDGKALCYVDVRDGISNIWAKPLDGGAPRQLTSFQSDQIFWFAWSRSGDSLEVSRGTVTSDVVLITDAR